ncbi:MAG: CDP-glycerol glycerophosphotransferase family protein [Cognaticolwellia sp.]
MAKLILMVTLLVNLCFYLLTKIIAKKKQLWVFGAWFGQRYSDNPKAFFEYINHQQPDINAIWICKNPDVITQVRALGFKAFHEKSLLGIYYQLRAEFAFVCQSLHDDIYAPCIGQSTQVVNLWHGLPLKKIMYDVFGDKVVKKNVIGKLFDTLSPYNKQRNDYLLATSEETQQTLSKAFRIPKERTLITGFPRNDALLTASAESTSDSYKCIYMPTFRGGKGTECDLFAQYGFDVKSIDTALQEHNIELVLRMHPVNKPPSYIIEQISQASAISIDQSADIFDSINQYDCMITDYSGGYFDFLLTGRPILFAPFDLENYKQQERDLYYHYEDVTIEPYAFDWPTLINNIIATKKGILTPAYYREYEQLKARFHAELAADSHSFSQALYLKLSYIK